MKAFITSIVILSIVITFVAINAVYVNNTSQQLLDAAYTLPDLEDLRASGVRDGGDGGNGSSNGENTSSNNEIISKGKDAIKNFTDIWNKNKNKLGLFIVYDYIHNIQAAVDQLTDFYTGEYYTDYCTQRKMLITAIKRMQEVEEFSIDSII